MQTSNALLLDIVGASRTRFVIPPYQRAYSWKRRQCEELWLDIFRAARSASQHFVGTLLYAPERNDENGNVRFSIVDGQQRTTTVSLILVALARHLKSTGTTLAHTTADEIEAHYLLLDGNSSLPGKLVLSRGDRASYFDALLGAKPDDIASENIAHNLAFFIEKMAEPDFDAEALWQGLNLLSVIFAEVEKTESAQPIFESLNSKGAPLTTADLVRNYLLLAETHTQQTYLYDTYWSIIESLFVPDPGSLRLDNAIQGWLSVRFRKVRAHGPGEVYSIFKRYVEDDYTGTTEDLLRELRNFCFVWAENYRYHAVKKFRTMDWAVNGAPTLTSGFTRQKAHNEAYAQRVRAEMRNTDATL